MENIEISNAMFGPSHPRNTAEIPTKLLLELVVGIANKYQIVRARIQDPGRAQPSLGVSLRLPPGVGLRGTCAPD